MQWNTPKLFCRWQCHSILRTAKSLSPEVQLKVGEHYKQEKSGRALQKKQVAEAKSFFKDDKKQETVPNVHSNRGEAWLVLTVIHTNCAAEREISPI